MTFPRTQPTTLPQLLNLIFKDHDTHEVALCKSISIKHMNHTDIVLHITGGYMFFSEGAEFESKECHIEREEDRIVLFFKQDTLLCRFWPQYRFIENYFNTPFTLDVEGDFLNTFSYDWLIRRNIVEPGTTIIQDAFV